MAENNVVLKIEDELVFVEGRHYIMAIASLIDVDTGESFTTKAQAREDGDRKGMNSDQLSGATSSYARKYALNALLLLDDNKDSDNTNEHGKGSPVKAQVVKPASSAVAVKPVAVATQAVTTTRQQKISALAALPNVDEVLKRASEISGKNVGKMEFVTTPILDSLYQEFIK